MNKPPLAYTAAVPAHVGLTACRIRGIRGTDTLSVRKVALERLNGLRWLLQLPDLNRLPNGTTFKREP